ncbi:COMM domain-containing protein 10 [Phytophthora citrophthora]|uniref:COMM domain-containing protein 10 n=1 Tax=Phytophthora citrophthora TaxID=4793 RepID=A0AAD9G9Y3_9STRA|nr:COMM domain-containing protein 10 [Phytophthora citrophthora]
MATSQSHAALNAVARDKLSQVLTRVLEKMAANEAEVFTASEKEQLQSMLKLSEEQIDAVVNVSRGIFSDAAAFGQVDRNLFVDDDVLHIVEKTWRKRGSSLATQIASTQPLETPALTLQKTDWRLHLEMGSSKLKGQSQPTAIFQLGLANMSSSSNETETLDIELSHTELRSLFLQLNAIQTELDTPSAA